MTATRPEAFTHRLLGNPRSPNSLYTGFWSIQAKNEGLLEAQKPVSQGVGASGWAVGR
jgi:hypothetical protein